MQTFNHVFNRVPNGVPLKGVKHSNKFIETSSDFTNNETETIEYLIHLIYNCLSIHSPQ